MTNLCRSRFEAACVLPIHVVQIGPPDYLLPAAEVGELVDAMGEGFFLPCPPVTRGEEVTAVALDAPACRNYAAKEFLLHAQNALMELIFGR
ncbi:MAG: hypothetical protein ACOC7V_05985 [Spirochaetota bacterium]